MTKKTITVAELYSLNDTPTTIHPLPKIISSTTYDTTGEQISHIQYSKPTKMSKQQIPEWFKGIIYEQGEEVTNPFTGDVFELNNLELSMYDYIMGSYYIFEVAPKTVTEKNVEELQEALKWFRETNLEAYKTLLD